MKKSILILILLFAVYAIFNVIKVNNANNIIRKNNALFESKISELNIKSEVSIEEIADFDWDKVYLIDPYTSKKDVYKIIGTKWGGIKDTYNDYQNSLIFVKNNKVVCYYYNNNKSKYLFKFSMEKEFGESYKAFSNKDELIFSIRKEEQLTILTLI